LAHIGQSQLVQSALPLRAQPAEHVWQSRPSYPSAHCAWRKAAGLSRSTSLSSASARVWLGVMVKVGSDGLLSLLMFVLAAGLERRCRVPLQAAFESHLSILRHASEVTRPVAASFLKRNQTPILCSHFLVEARIGSKMSAPNCKLSPPAPLRLPMPCLGENDVLSRAEATPRRTRGALLSAAAEDVTAILAGEALICSRSALQNSGGVDS
jgi:hypothetical protein